MEPARTRAGAAPRVGPRPRAHAERQALGRCPQHCSCTPGGPWLADPIWGEGSPPLRTCVPGLRPRPGRSPPVGREKQLPCGRAVSVNPRALGSAQPEGTGCARCPPLLTLAPHLEGEAGPGLRERTREKCATEPEAESGGPAPPNPLILVCAPCSPRGAAGSCGHGREALVGHQPCLFLAGL